MSFERPIYENADTLQQERIVANAYARARGFNVHKLPRQYRLDFALTAREDIVEFFEVKCRRKTMEAMGSFMLLSSAKVMAARSLNANHAVPVVLVVRFLRDIYFRNLHDLPVEQAFIGGRVDRGDAEDIEPVCRIPLRSGWSKLRVLPIDVL